MPATLHPPCPPIRLSVSVCFGDEPCRKCGQVPDVRLTRREIRECLKAKHGRAMR